MLFDSALDISSDPDHLAPLELCQLALEAKRRMRSSWLSARTVAERSGTSSAQLYRLLDPTDSDNSAMQLLALLAIGDATVTVTATRQAGIGPPAGAQRSRFSIRRPDPELQGTDE